MEHSRNPRQGRNKSNYNKNTPNNQTTRFSEQNQSQKQRQHTDNQRKNQRGNQNQNAHQRQQQKNNYVPFEVPLVKPTLPSYVCPYCAQAITEISSALADKESGVPVHFDCVIDILKERENLKPNERITYIGQGRFAVVYFENPHDLRKFTILRIIEWEKRETKIEWRAEIADCYSQVK